MKCWVSLELWYFHAEWNIGRFPAVREFSWTSAQPNLRADIFNGWWAVPTLQGED